MFKKKAEEEVPKKNIPKLSKEFKEEIENQHKFKVSHVIWPVLSLFILSMLGIYIYSNYIINNSGTVIDRKSPDEKIQSKPEVKEEQTPAATTPTPATVEPPKPQAPQYIEYIVKQGDTLSGIGQTYQVYISEILSANPGLAQDDLKIGQVIKIPKK
ncbi:MAG: LysM peptidoglycan-binding domain-containing protein [Patescibacteria group bacterium]|nr:LysM peptidoglycan-binding domain-containing protein [Patescibacteria group bacterium]